MLRASQLLAVLGGLVGLLTTTLYLADVSAQFDPSLVSVVLGILSYPLLVVGIVGGGLVRRYPRRAAYLQDVGLVGALLTLGVLALLMLAFAVGLAYRGRGEAEEAGRGG